MLYLGLDLSLTASGVVLIHEAGEIVKQEVVKSKPVGKKPIDELNRILGIRDRIMAIVEHDSHRSLIKMSCIEAPAYMAKGTSLVQLGALSFFVREALMTRGIPFLLVAPTSAKKHLTGSGKGDKNIILMETYKRYGGVIMNDNVADALTEAHIARQFCMTGLEQAKLPKFQQEVIALLKKQI